jgi:two-component system response regulator AtoC
MSAGSVAGAGNGCLSANPFSEVQLFRKACGVQAAAEHNLVQRDPSFELPPEDMIFGKSGRMQGVRKEIEQIAPTDLPVLIEGEAGCGKEVLGRLVHQWSSRGGNHFVKVPGPALPLALLESKLIGYDHQPLTVPWIVKLGRVQAAHRGTLFLDEVSELEMSFQAALLQLLPEKRAARAWGQALDVRLICSSRHHLQDQVESGFFRQDLFYRINVIYIHLPPLRNRAEDIPGLVKYLLGVYRRKFNAPARAFPSNLTKLFQSYHWPGNIRQLENLIKRYVVTGSEGMIGAELLSQPMPRAVPQNSPLGPSTLRKLMREAVKKEERRIILQALYTHRWNRKETARALGISYQALLHKMR